VDLFTPTLAEQAQVEAEVELAASDAAKARDQLMRLNSVAKGPMTVEDRLLENFEADEFDLHRLERLNAETRAIRERLAQDKEIIAKELTALEARQAKFDELVAERTSAMQDEDFNRAVKTLEQLPPKQAKGVMQQYMAQGKTDDAVNYLAAMQLRKSASILKAFKSEEEIPQVAKLLEQLRDRGKDPFARSQADKPKEAPAS